MDRPTCIILIGISGAGKTTYAEKYVAEYNNVVHLSSDKIREELWGDEAAQGDNNEVFSLMQTRAVEALNNGQSVVYDATNATRKDRAGIISVCPKFAKIEAHVIWAPIEVCVKRDSNRKRSVGKEVIDRMLKRFQAPFYDENIDEIKIIRPDNFNYKKYCRDIFGTMRIPHDNPNHTLSIYEHCREAQCYADTCDKDDTGIIPIAAMWHDAGKPYCKAFVDNKGNPCEIAHYYSHQNISAYLAYGIGYESPLLAWLIGAHMEPFFNSKYYQKLPAYLKSYVDLLHECDLAAH